MGKNLKEYAEYHGVAPSNVRELLLMFVDGPDYCTPQAYMDLGVDLEGTGVEIVASIRQAIKTLNEIKGGTPGEMASKDYDLIRLEGLLDFLEK